MCSRDAVLIFWIKATTYSDRLQVNLESETYDRLRRCVELRHV